MEFWFYNPHPGLLGCTKSLPDLMKIAAESLSGKRVGIEDAIETLAVHLPKGYSLGAVFYDEAETHGMMTLQEGDVFANGKRVAGKFNWRLIEFGQFLPDENTQFVREP